MRREIQDENGKKKGKKGTGLELPTLGDAQQYVEMQGRAQYGNYVTTHTHTHTHIRTSKESPRPPYQMWLHSLLSQLQSLGGRS